MESKRCLKERESRLKEFEHSFPKTLKHYMLLMASSRADVWGPASEPEPDRRRTDSTTKPRQSLIDGLLEDVALDLIWPRIKSGIEHMEDWSDDALLATTIHIHNLAAVSRKWRFMMRYSKAWAALSMVKNNLFYRGLVGQVPRSARAQIVLTWMVVVPFVDALGRMDLKQLEFVLTIVYGPMAYRNRIKWRKKFGNNNSLGQLDHFLQSLPEV
ncbi:unnamed protein product [Calypogeia fissa]